MMAKLTEKQQKLLDKMFEFGGWMSRKHIATYHSVSVADALVKKGMLELTDTRNYKLTYEGGAALTVSKPAAIAQPVSVATDAAPAFTPIEAQGWHHLIDPRVMIELPADSPFIEQLTDRRIDAWFAEPSSHTQYVVWKFDENEYQIGIRYDEPTDEKLTAFKAWVLAQHSAPAPDAAQTAAADAEAWGEPTPVRDIDIEIDDLPQINMPIVPASALAVGAVTVFGADVSGVAVYPKDEQIAALTRELEAARALSSALQRDMRAIHQRAKYMINDVYDDDERTRRYFEEIAELSAPTDPDAAPDNGQRVSAWTPSVGDRVEVPCYNGNYPLDDPIRFGTVEWVEGTNVGVRGDAYNFNVEQFDAYDLKPALKAEAKRAAWIGGAGDFVRVRLDAEFAKEHNIRIGIRDSRLIGRVVRYDHKCNSWRVDFGAGLPLAWSPDQLETIAQDVIEN